MIPPLAVVCSMAAWIVSFCDPLPDNRQLEKPLFCEAKTWCVCGPSEDLVLIYVYPEHSTTTFTNFLKYPFDFHGSVCVNFQ